MKKLMILAAVILTGAVTNAASVKWTAANIYDSTTTSKYSGDVMLYAYEYGSDASTASLVSTFSTTTAGSVSQTFSSDNLDGTKNYNFYFVIEDNGNVFTSVTKEKLVG